MLGMGFGRFLCVVAMVLGFLQAMRREEKAGGDGGDQVERRSAFRAIELSDELGVRLWVTWVEDCV